MRLPLLALCLAAWEAQAYELRKDSTGEVVRWPGKVTFVVDSRLAEMMSEKDSVAAVAAAKQSIQDATPGIDITLTVGATKEVGFDFDAQSQNENTVTATNDWPYEENAIAVTIVTVDTRLHQIIDADVAFNVEHRKFKVVSLLESSAAGIEQDDIQNTVTHELGHALGLAHNANDPEVVMYPSARRGEIKKRFLSSDDRAGLNHLYPPDGSAANLLYQTLGCQAAGGGGDFYALIGILLALRGLSKMRTARVFLIFSLFLPSWAMAAPLERAPAPIAEASLAGTFQVSARRSFQKDGTKLLFTELDLELIECMKGACLTKMSVIIPGGRLGDFEQWVEGLSVPEVGEQVGLAQSPPSFKGRISSRVYRMNQEGDSRAFSRGLARVGLTLNTQKAKVPLTHEVVSVPTTQKK